MKSIDEKSKTQESTKLVNLGGTGDCGFRSIAGGVIDLFVRGKLKQQFAENQYNHLLEEYFKFYPVHTPPQANTMSAAEKLAYLYHTVHEKDLTSFSIELGYVLRQMAVDEICDNFEDYPGAFVTEHEGTSPDEMGQQNTWIDETALAAVAKVLDIPVTVVANDKQQITRTYNEQANQQDNTAAITIQLQRKHYIPWISTEVANQQPQQKANRKVFSPVAQNHRKVNYAEIKHSYEEHRHFKALEKSIQNKLEKKDSKELLNLFIKYQNSNDFLEGYVARHIDPQFKQFLDHSADNAELTEFFKPLLVQKLSLAFIHKFIPEQEINTLKTAEHDKVTFFTGKPAAEKAVKPAPAAVANLLPAVALTT